MIQLRHHVESCTRYMNIHVGIHYHNICSNTSADFLISLLSRPCFKMRLVFIRGSFYLSIYGTSLVHNFASCMTLIYHNCDDCSHNIIFRTYKESDSSMKTSGVEQGMVC